MSNKARIGTVSGMILAAAVALVGTPAAAISPALSGAHALAGEDVIIFKDGTIKKGRVVEQTATKVKFMLRVGTIESQIVYSMADVLRIEKGEDGGVSDPAPGVATRATTLPKAKSNFSEVMGAGSNTVYVVELDGVFGEDISEVPLRDAVKDAQRRDADYVVFIMDNDWSMGLVGGLKEDEIPDEVGAFDELFRAEDMDEVVSNEIQANWQKQPKVIFWVKQAMGGAAFLPLVCSEIYFHSDARLGGVGNLAEMFDGVGDERVREKQRSLRLGHAEGMAQKGGYDAMIVRAMTRRDYQLWVRDVGGKPVLIDNPDAVLPSDTRLTDDGQDDRADTIEELARGRGNDVLTLDAKLAEHLQISKGTVDTVEELLFELGIARDYAIIDGRSDRIMEKWSSGLKEAKRSIRKLMRQYAEIQVDGNYRQRTAARGQQIRTLQQIRKILLRYGKSITGQWRAQWGIPSKDDLKTLIELIKLQQLGDK